MTQQITSHFAGARLHHFDRHKVLSIATELARNQRPEDPPKVAMADDERASAHSVAVNASINLRHQNSVNVAAPKRERIPRRLRAVEHSQNGVNAAALCFEAAIRERPVFSLRSGRSGAFFKEPVVRGRPVAIEWRWLFFFFFAEHDAVDLILTMSIPPNSSSHRGIDGVDPSRDPTDRRRSGYGPRRRPPSNCLNPRRLRAEPVPLRRPTASPPNH